MKLFNGMTVENNELAISGVMVSELRRKYGTPLYVYDENMLENQCDTFISNFKSEKFKLLWPLISAIKSKIVSS